MNFMGIDIGTSGCKAAVFDSNGQQLALSYREYNVIFTDDGGVELNSDEVMNKCFQVIKACNALVPRDSVKALAVSSQGEAFTAINADGKCLCNAMVSSDKRSLPLVKSWTDKFGDKKLYQITGHTAHSVFTLFKLLWLKENRSEVWKKAHKFLCFEDLLHFHLGLDPTIGWPLAGRTMLFDIRKHVWSDEILSMLEINEQQLAKPMQSGRIVGRIDQKIARDLGFSEDAVVVSGGHDQVCSALGAGVVNPGMAMYASGTVECISPCFEKPILSESLFQNNLCTYDHAIGGMYTSVAYSLTGGNILKWFRDEFGSEEINAAKNTGKDAYELLLENTWDKPSRLMVLPYFTPSGTPYFDTETKGAVFGLRISTKRAEFIRSLLEGITFEMRLNLDILEQVGYEINELSVVGGGAKSVKWLQMKADITGKKVNIPQINEAGCLGAAMLACAAYSGDQVLKLVDKWVKVDSHLQPDKTNLQYYNKKFEKYKKLYKAVRDIDI